MSMNTMTAYDVTTSVPNRVWEGFVASEPDGSFLQSAAWGESKEKWGWKARRVALRGDGLLVAGAQILFRMLPLGRTMAYIPRGPVLSGDDPELLAALFEAIHHLCRAEGALLLTVEPNWPVPARAVELLQRHGFRSAASTIQPSATIIVDLRPCEEDILAGMHSKWRYNIRLSARKEIVVREGGAADFDIYHTLTETTGERNDFGTRPRGYYEDVWRAFHPDNSRVFIAEYQQRPLAAIVVIKCGKTATYLYGASSNEERNRMPNHALQWAAMQWARNEGCHQYDLWGIPPEIPLEGEVEDGEGGLWGVYRFKRGFGGQVVKYPGAFDYPYSRIGYRLYQE
jgi:lipid II:glycine glycyltransferase (peptidoglycan interpeptide bridge formation enzyme)